MNFGEALERLKDGERISRPEWGGMTRVVLHCEHTRKTVIRHIGLSTTESSETVLGCKVEVAWVVPWTPTSDDMLAEDWEVE
jgi:trehalose utilization protein